MQLRTWITGLVIATQALAAQVGWSQIDIPGAPPDALVTTVALYYPTQAAATQVVMGPFVLNVALQAEPEPSLKGLILISHGVGGSELAHSRLAEALARQGYLVAALRHPGDNWKDGSLLEKTPERYFDVRPRQVSHVIDALLVDPKWKDRIARGARGPRIGADPPGFDRAAFLANLGGELVAFFDKAFQD